MIGFEWIIYVRLLILLDVDKREWELIFLY